MPQQSSEVQFIAQSLMEGNSAAVVQRLVDDACEVTLLGQTYTTDDIVYCLEEVLPTEFKPVISASFTSATYRIKFFDLEVVAR